MKMHLGKKRRRLSPVVVLALLVLLLLLIFEAYRWLMPFVSRNPLYRDATIGETVIDDWRYSGEDEEGYLRFYNTDSGQSVVIPPTEKLFGADGKFVVIEKAEPGSLTYAPPLESAPPIWYLVMAGVVGLSFWVMIIRIKQGRKRRMRLRKTGQGTRLAQMTIPTRSRRFRAVKRQPPRFRR